MATQAVVSGPRFRPGGEIRFAVVMYGGVSLAWDAYRQYRKSHPKNTRKKDESAP